MLKYICLAAGTETTCTTEETDTGTTILITGRIGIATIGIATIDTGTIGRWRTGLLAFWKDENLSLFNFLNVA